MTRSALSLGAGAAALLAACGGTASPPAASTTTTSGSMSSTMSEMSENTSCAPSGTTLKLTAKDTKFDTECLAAPAGQAITIHFDNQDPLPHNVTLLTADPDKDKTAKQLFNGELVTGPKTIDYPVPAQPAGTYHYHCSVHPTQMYGTYVVK